MLKEAELILIRRKLHQIPELALAEYQTQKLLLAEISKLPQDYLEVRTVQELPTAIFVRVRGSNPEKTIGYRADMDALPVDEQLRSSFISQIDGQMHACGHDFHMTVALGVLSHLSEHQPRNNFVFFFQPGEESQNGGKLAYDAGLFSGDFRPDEFFALHVNPALPAGTIGCNAGTLFAGTTEVNVDFHGTSGHAAFPHQANDMIVAASQFITQAQTIVSRNVNPTEGGVLSFGKMTAGTIRNVIAGEVRLEGTIRGFTQPMIELIGHRLKEVAAGIAVSFNAEVNVTLNQGGYLPVVNDPHTTAAFISFMQNNSTIQFTQTKAAMTGEDFGYLLAQIPGTMFWLGVGPTSSLHSATFNPNEAALQKGVTAFTKFIENYEEINQ
ncbi:M20 M25 M40 family peptidase [Amylolactobacillus amylotrophicus DSM 20534]|uniref:N-acetyldiaminopimelate deacetylase n=3 Tax=Amylolactobacillus TaxID=2767876 RepID=A0A1L6XBT3_9LACO|nr:MULTISPECIES: N-acetyldiaminopimelate deacetylase [Amylolactobacillus]APT18438.1 N-acetyldiaminopimelate deacetylase [Amylolactobacillus amylophilus DSM 20533 = JCM 1125]KRK38225.1 M20 M25 M40 family peptidase [Amylolactobacillus amylotrophicus DSM 20534]KRM43133.1 M20 M25 M40 family peptidase [Amylolactobacillus amylophilus DSM 20533 = JCM 1125]GED80467.1 N-acetyldiaminopimelate deacetylase [Amylolactobacillus amylophilus]